MGQAITQLAEQENESNFEYHENGPQGPRGWFLKKSDQGATHFINFKKTKKNSKFDHLEKFQSKNVLTRSTQLEKLVEKMPNLTQIGTLVPILDFGS